MILFPRAATENPKLSVSTGMGLLTVRVYTLGITKLSAIPALKAILKVEVIG
jgi:hypothetical protein